MQFRGVTIDDTFAEAFQVAMTRVIVTAVTPEWAQHAARNATGFACSIIGCDCEAGIERDIEPADSPDGRPGIRLLFAAFSTEALQKAVSTRVGQCIMTCPTTACFSGITGSERTINVGGQLRFFGDGKQSSKLLGSNRYWRIPTMDGEFICEESFGVIKGVGGGNLIILADSVASGLHAAQRCVDDIKELDGVILPFPGGIVRSGSKVGSRYKALKASSNDAYCPSLMQELDLTARAGVRAVYEIVIDGLSTDIVAEAMRRGLQAASLPGVLAITAGNYGGKLGPFHFHLHELLEGAQVSTV